MVMMNQLEQNTVDYFEEAFGLDYALLLEPIDAHSPTGKSVRGSTVYRAIETARRRDDDSLPLGGWEHDLKRGDWAAVTKLTLEALLGQSKDMQLVAWLLEAQIHLRGLAAVAPCLMLMENLCRLYWDTLHPQAEDDAVEHRANIITWISEKLQPALRLTPLIGNDPANSCNWSDWEQACRNEQIRLQTGQGNTPAPEGSTMQTLCQCISATDTGVYLWLQQTIAFALETITLLCRTLDALCGGDAPGMDGMSRLLQQILSFVEAELHKRGDHSAVASKKINNLPDAMPIPIPTLMYPHNE
jgi:type VI secretion system ImpA family protein